MEIANSVFKLISNTATIEDWIVKCIDIQAVQLASLFDIYNFPEDYKISIHFLEKYNFVQLAKSYGVFEKCVNCHAMSCDSIYIIDYYDVSKELSEDEYCKTLLHECIHILQHISTGLIPSKAIWLYESIACFLSGQETYKPLQFPSWELFKSNFYSVDDCYSVAYMYGQLFINIIGLEKLIAYEDDLNALEMIGKKIYYKLQKELL